MLKHLEGFTAHDISCEDYRAYVYDDGREYVIENPMTLYLKESDTNSHRVVDDVGECHYVAKGWVAIKFPAKALEF